MKRCGGREIYLPDKGFDCAGCLTFCPFRVLAPLGRTDSHPLSDGCQGLAGAVAESHSHLVQLLSAQRTSGANDGTEHLIWLFSHITPRNLRPPLAEKNPVARPMGLAPLCPGPEHPAEWDLGGGEGGCLPESSASGRVPERQAPQGEALVGLIARQTPHILKHSGSFPCPQSEPDPADLKHLIKAPESRVSARERRKQLLDSFSPLIHSSKPG